MKHLLHKEWRLAVALVIGVLSSLFSAPIDPPLYAHGGGTPRLTSVPVGPYRLYAWSEPEPWRVGQVHLSLAVTIPNPDSNSNQIEMPVTDADITVTYTPMVDNGAGNVIDTSQTPIVVKAVRQEFLSDFYYEADPTLTRVGDWQIHVAVAGPEGAGSTEFAMQTFPERTLNWTLIAGAGLLLVVIIVLIALWSRSQQPAQAVHRPHRGVRRAQQRRGSKTPVRKET
jgi:hypothetical protein